MNTKIIFKYIMPLAFGELQDIQMPSDLEIKYVGEQNGMICFWGTTDIANEKRVVRHFQIVGTGTLFDDANLTYMGTVQQKSDQGYPEMVWHLFEKVAS